MDIIDVAKAAGVSPSTVSRAFNHPDLLRASTRKKIEKAVQKLGYIRNRAAQTMHGKRSGTIGLIVPTVNHAIFSQAIQSFSEAIDEAGFTLLIGSHGYNLERENQILRKFLEHRVDGVALVGLDHMEAVYQLIGQQDVPTIAIWNYDEGARISCIGVQNEEAGELVAKHIFDLGHRDIGFLFPPTGDNDRARGRLEGALSVIQESGLMISPEHRRVVQYSISDAKEMCLDLLNKAPSLTALICGNDVIAQGAVYACLAMSIKIPDEMSIVGIGDFPGSADLEPALSTVRIPARTIGNLAGQELCKAITSDSPSYAVKTKLEVQLFERGTTGVHRKRTH